MLYERYCKKHKTNILIIKKKNKIIIIIIIIYFSVFKNLQKNTTGQLRHLWPIDRLPPVVLRKLEIEILNDNLFSEMWFSFMKHCQIDEASMTSSYKLELFVHTLQCCEEGIIEVFHDICRRYEILCATQGNFCFDNERQS